MPYSCTDFLEGRLHDGLEVFEYGSGNSTKWFSQRVGNVTAVEHDDEWHSKIDGETPREVTILHRAEGKYAEAIDSYVHFDTIVIDRRRRDDCAKHATDNLSDGGVVIWDDTFDEKDTPGMVHLKDSGYRELSFQEMGPVTSYLQRTSIFIARRTV
jgi:tRNA A58 N-methylase Trm61